MERIKHTKTELIDAVYEETGLNRKDIRSMLDAFIKTVKGALAANIVVELRGFGTFEVRIRKGRRKARNPRTGEAVSVNAHGIAAFKPGRELKQVVWQIHDSDAEEPHPTESAGAGEHEPQP
jgi:integration host factor subunit beta